MRNLVKKGLIISLCMILIMGMFTGCSSKDTDTTTTAAITETTATTSNENEVKFTAGTYKGTAEGKEGNIEVAVTFSTDKIESIEILNQKETEGIGKEALDTMKSQILESQSLGVDSVSGASYSSEALLKAVEAAVVEAGGDVEVLKSRAVVKSAADKVESYDTDIVVVGAGASGVSAAVSAADEGSKVILIEKTATVGGASNLSWAGKFYNSSAATASGLTVAVEDEISNWIVNNHWRVDAAAVRQYVVKSGETYDWLSSKGYNTTFINFFGEQLHMLPPYETRQGLLRNMIAESVEANGGMLMTETTGKSLITDENGAITGIIAEKLDGTKVEIHAKIVILATGGYAANAEMVKELFGFEGINGGLGQNVGEGLKMAWEAGAKVPDNVGGQMLHQTLASATAGLKKEYSSFEASYPLMLTYLPTVMNVGPSGARFRDEAATLTAVAAANTSAFNGAYHYVIVSQDQIDKLQSSGMQGLDAPRLPGMPPEFYADFKDQFTLDTPWDNVIEVMDKMVANGDGFKGNTIEELATNAGMDVALFKDAFDQYETAIATGVDTAFGKDPAYLSPMGTEGPFYAIKAEINNLGSVGGLLVNAKFQVLNDNRVPLKGLYAVGLESEGVLFNDTYVGNGVGIGYSFTSGRLGGTYAAQELNK
ncbi:FAD-dependent oxidoreductase [Fusibacter bizertensis]